MIKRLSVWLLGMGLGVVTVYLIITVGFDILPSFTAVQTPQGVSIARFGYIYFTVASVAVGLVYVIILDAFADSHILPD